MSRETFALDLVLLICACIPWVIFAYELSLLHWL